MRARLHDNVARAGFVARIRLYFYTYCTRLFVGTISSYRHPGTSGIIGKGRPFALCGYADIL